MRRHHLVSGEQAVDVSQVAASICGAQAQVLSAAGLQLAVRAPGFTRADLERALWTERTLVKTWTLRGTLHVLPAVDLPLYSVALRRNRRRLALSGWQHLGLAEGEVDDVLRAVVDTLADGPLGRAEVARRLPAPMSERVRPWLEYSWGGLLRLACIEGQACFGPVQGSTVTFVRLDRWLPELPQPSEREAQAQILRRYLRAYGPATIRDFVFWSGLLGTEARQAWQSLQAELVEVSVEGKRSWLLAGDLEALFRDRGNDLGVRILPNFDPLVLGHADKSWLVERSRHKAVFRQAGWISPTVLVDGEVKGVWQSTQRGNRLEIRVEAFGEFSPEQRRQVERQAMIVGRYHGMEASVVSWA